MDARRLKSFADAYDEHIWHVYGFFGYRVSTRELAEDLTQTTFERALKAWTRFDPAKASAKTWLVAIAQNVLIDHYRRDHSSREQPLESHGEEASPGAAAAEVRALGPDPELQRALEELGERERQVIALRFGGDFSGAQIAELTDLSLANVQQILSRSLRNLRGQLEGGALEPSGGEQRRRAAR